MATRRYSEEKLAKMYAQSIEDYGCSTLFMFILEHCELSCLGRVKALETDWLPVMNRECKKSFLWFLYNNEENNENYRLLLSTIHSL